MKYITILLFSALTLFSAAQPAFAFYPDEAGGAGGGGSCSWDQFLDRLGCQETGFVCAGATCPKSCDKQYTTISDRSDDPSWGKWQFTPSTWRTYTGVKYPQCQGQAYALSIQCRPAQKWATQKFMADAIKWFEGNNWCGLKLGQTISGFHQNTRLNCQINKSGLLSAYHNSGKNACTFAGGNSKWSPQINWRICDAGNIPFPENCTPSTSDPVIPDQVTPNNNPTVLPSDQGFQHLNHFDGLAASLKHIWVGAFQLMTEHLTTTMMQQVQIIGTFFDAKHQLETQRLMQQKYAEAHKDYHPSEQMCQIGTFVRNLSNSEERAKLTQSALTRAMIDRALRTGDVKTFNTGSDDDTRLRSYIDTFCNVADNAEQNERLCKNSGDPEQQNADINFTRTIDVPLTLNIGLLSDTEKENITKEEENIFAFLDYIFMNDAFPWISSGKTTLHRFIEPYQEMRSLIAMRSVAQNSFAHIIAQKTQGTENKNESVGPFIKSLMREMGIEDDEIERTLGKHPSYFAQMEVLTKKIYQHPEFISNLYDKPANVKRIRAAMTAIKLMQDRDIHDALMRREMLMSIMLELKLRQKQQDLTLEVKKINSLPPEASTHNKKATGKKSGF